MEVAVIISFRGLIDFSVAVDPVWKSTFDDSRILLSVDRSGIIA
jgi:hypothetical protein